MLHAANKSASFAVRNDWSEQWILKSNFITVHHFEFKDEFRSWQ